MAESGARMKPIRVFLVDDHIIFLEGLARLLSDEPMIRIVGTAIDGRKAVDEIGDLKPDVVLMDISMPNLNGIEASRLIKTASPNTKVLILSMHESEPYLRRVLEAGAVGYLLKEATADEVIMAIKKTHRGGSYLSPSMSRKLIHDYLETRKRVQGEEIEPVLTGREREILQLLAEGNSQQAIARSLSLSPLTVRTHRRHIMKKLKFRHITDLVRYAIRMGIIEA